MCRGPPGARDPTSENAIRRCDVVVHVEVETTAKALRKADRPTAQLNPVGGSRRELTPGLLDLPAQDLSDEDTPYCAQSLRVLGEEEPELEGNTEHPLAEWHVREHVVRHVGRGGAHAPRVARRADATPLARERYEQLRTARRASRAKGSAGMDAALQILPELALDVSGQATIVLLARRRTEALEVGSDDPDLARHSTFMMTLRLHLAPSSLREPIGLLDDFGQQMGNAPSASL
jgi:hypothetical protein